MTLTVARLEMVDNYDGVELKGKTIRLGVEAQFPS
jgi:hypothetical protein